MRGSMAPTLLDSFKRRDPCPERRRAEKQSEGPEEDPNDPEPHCVGRTGVDDSGWRRESVEAVRHDRGW